MPPTKIMIIRHGEKPPKSGGPPFGVTFDGTKSDDSLVPKGWERAGALGRLFAPGDGAAPRTGLAVPDFIYAAGVDHASKSVRSEEVVSVVCGLLPDAPYDDSFGPDKYKEAADDILTKTGTVLVAWEHHMIKHLVKHLTDKDGRVPCKAPYWCSDRFDMILVLDAGTSTSTSAWTLTQVPQMLLPGDSPDPLPADKSGCEQDDGSADTDLD